MKDAWCVELVTDSVLYVRYFASERDARRDASRVFQLHVMPVVFKTQVFGSTPIG